MYIYIYIPTLEPNAYTWHLLWADFKPQALKASCNVKVGFASLVVKKVECLDRSQPSSTM